RILRLAAHRPEGVSPSEWAYYVHWTWNLHSNWGGYLSFDSKERDGFLAEFDRRLNEGIDVGSINWIWDQYVEHSTGGRHYSRNYRPTDAHVKCNYYEGQEGGYKLQWWLDESR